MIASQHERTIMLIGEKAFSNCSSLISIVIPDGITNIKNNSTVKFKDNGDIDIFVNNNTGIRISPNYKSIEVYGNFKINGKEIGEL